MGDESRSQHCRCNQSKWGMQQSKMKPTDETNYSGVTSEHGDEANQISAMKPMDARMKR
jgi:hypothetical protein